jgi:hypothetical protein
MQCMLFEILVWVLYNLDLAHSYNLFVLGSASSSNYAENIRRKHVKFGREGYPVPGICAPLCGNMSAFSPSRSKLPLHKALPLCVRKIFYAHTVHFD